MPLRKISGTNTEQVVSTELSMGVNTSLVPFTMASSNVLPCRHRCMILSMTMMELSTIMPTPRIRPDSEMILSEMPNRWKLSSVRISESGMVMMISNGSRQSFMKRNSTRQASRAPT